MKNFFNIKKLNKETMTDFIKAFEDAAKDPNTKFQNHRKLTVFTSSFQKEVWWEAYCGSKKCNNCEESADYVATKGIKSDNVLGYACKQHTFSARFLC